MLLRHRTKELIDYMPIDSAGTEISVSVGLICTMHIAMDCYVRVEGFEPPTPTLSR